MTEIDNAHYLAINDMAVNEQTIATGGKDTKVRLWFVADLLGAQFETCSPFAELGDAQQEIT